MAADSIPVLKFATDQISKARTMDPQQSSVEELKVIVWDRSYLRGRNDGSRQSSVENVSYRGLEKVFRGPRLG
eukprot:scaffold9000_cov106-Cylindrotheca_fusiformis.AAC.2